MSLDLIVYFSHDKENYVNGQIKMLEVGNTKVIVNKLKDILNADIFEIKPLYEYPFHYQECTEIARKELNENNRPKIADFPASMKQYENIYLGYPNWWGTMPMCICSFLEKYDFSKKHIYPFCTHEGSGMGSSEKAIKKLCPESIVHKGLAIAGHQVLESDEKIKEWLEG